MFFNNCLLNVVLKKIYRKVQIKMPDYVNIHIYHTQSICLVIGPRPTYLCFVWDVQHVILNRV